MLSVEGLIVQSRDGSVQPRLAERWTESSDGRTLTFHLRPNVFFHDNTPLDAHAVKDSLERSLNTSDRNLAPGLADIEGVETVGARDVVIRVARHSTFVLDDIGIAITKPGPNGPVGTGPFVTSSRSSNEVTMSAVQHYYGGKPAIDRVVFRAYPAIRTAWAAMMRGDIDLLYEVSPDALEFIEHEGSVGVFTFLRPYVHAVALNSARPNLRDTRIRKALNYAVNRSVLIERVLHGRGVPANGPTWPLHWAYDSSLPQFDYDPLKAAALMNAAGLPAIDRTDDTRLPARLRFTCLVPANFAVWERMALIVQRDLAHIGVQMDLESVPFSTLNRRIADGDFDAVIMEFVVGHSITRPYLFWHSSSRLNSWTYRNSHIDAAFETARTASSEAEYKSAFRSLQSEAVEDPPAIFLALGNTSRAVNTRRFEIVAPPGTDILPTIADWRPVASPSTN